MCLGIPGQVICIDMESPLRIGRVNFAGVEREVSLALVPEATVGAYVIVHVGYAISVIDQDIAHRTLTLLDELASAQSEVDRGFNEVR